uniref:Uncharacterized protein n=1 Tax=Fagus sylvatica TaxID=28930 RepID=A0A2N9FYZ2_FAGSY
MKKLEQAVSNTKQFTQNIATLVQGISQGNTTRGIEIGQGSSHVDKNQPQIEIVATNVEIPIGYPINLVGPKERPNNTNPIIPITEPPRVEQPRAEQPITEPPRMEKPWVEQPRMEPPLRVEPPRFEQPRMEPPRVESPCFKQLRLEPPRVKPPRFEQPRMEPPPRVEPPQFEQPRMEPPRVEPPRFEQPRTEPPRVEPPRFEQPRMEPPRMEPPRMGQPQFQLPRMEPFQPRMGQLEAGFRFEPPQRPSIYLVCCNTCKLYQFMGGNGRKIPVPFCKSNVGVSMADLVQLKQKPDESAEQFIIRFKRIRTRCLTTLPEAEYIKIAIDGLNFEGKSTSIQGYNVHIDKGKSVAYPIEQPAFSYKEILRREPPKPSQEDSEDDTICERYSHILAKCFTKTKEEDSKRQQEPEIGRPESRSVSHSQSIQSRLGPQYVQQKMAQSRLTSHQTLDSRFESIRRPRMIRPPISEARRWVTLESLGLKPIHRQEYKYGYNPYFSRMMRTQRQRWIRQKVALHQEYERKDHYSSRSTFDSDSMEVITGAEAPEYLKGPYVKKEDTIDTPAKDIAIPIMKNDIGHKVQSTVWFGRKKRSPKGRKEAKDNSIKAERSQETSMENIQVNLIEDTEDIEDIKNIEGIEGLEDIEDLEGIEDIEGVENFEGIEDIDDIEAERTDDVEEIEELEAMECTETDEVLEIQHGKPEIELEEPKNGIDQNGNPSRVTVGPEEPLTMEDLFKLGQNLEETKTRPEIENGLNYYVEDVE